MKIGDKVKYSDRNLYCKNTVSAYANMEGIVENIFDDGGFVLDCGTSTLVVPSRGYYTLDKGVWIYLNDVLIFHKFKHTFKERLNCLFHNIFY
jgi:hypothetical protein